MRGPPSKRHFLQRMYGEAEEAIYALRERLQRYPQAVAAILQAARSLNRPVETLQPRDIRSLV